VMIISPRTTVDSTEWWGVDLNDNMSGRFIRFGVVAEATTSGDALRNIPKKYLIYTIHFYVDYSHNI
jgi:hypothetical protein